jgi:hypothetical protein
VIEINLLPDEYTGKKAPILLPLREFLIGFLVLVFLLGVWSFFRQQGLKKQLAAIETEAKALSPEISLADEVIRQMKEEILPKKAFLDTIDQPDERWDYVMNLISDQILDGLWLTTLRCEKSPDFLIRIEGFSQLQRGRSSVSLVADFITQLKKHMEEGMTGSGTQPTPTSGGSRFRMETFTQQRDVGSDKMTHFMVEFRKK